MSFLSSHSPNKNIRFVFNKQTQISDWESTFVAKFRGAKIITFLEHSCFLKIFLLLLVPVKFLSWKCGTLAKTMVVFFLIGAILPLIKAQINQSYMTHIYWHDFKQARSSLNAPALESDSLSTLVSLLILFTRNRYFVPVANLFKFLLRCIKCYKNLWCTYKQGNRIKRAP